MTNQNNQPNSCCAPDGTCSATHNQPPKPSKPELHFLTKLKEDQLKEIESTLKDSLKNDDQSNSSSFIQDSLSQHLPIYFLKKVLKSYKKESAEPLLIKIAELLG